MPENTSESLDAVEQSYEYLVAYASDDQTAGVDQAVAEIERMQEELQVQRRALESNVEEGGGDENAFFEWVLEQTTLTLSAIGLYVQTEEITRETVKALLSLPPFRNCLTAYLFLEEIGEI